MFDMDEQDKTQLSLRRFLLVAKIAYLPDVNSAMRDKH